VIRKILFLSVELQNYLYHWQSTTVPDMIHRYKWRMCRERSWAKTKNNRIHRKQKNCPNGRFI